MTAEEPTAGKSTAGKATTISKPLPDVDDPVTAPFWAATRESRLVVPRCDNCSYRFWPPEPVCPQCQHTSFTWEDISQVGVLWSYAVYHRALDPAFADDIPYAVALVELEDGLRMYGIVDGSLDHLVVGRTATAVFDRVNDAVTFVRWRIWADEGAAEDGTAGD